MSNNHLSPNAGGDPAGDVSTDLKNQPAAPRDGNDFPDAPDEDPSGRPQDKPDLDDFAERLGTNTISTGDGLGAVPDEGSPSRPAVADSRTIAFGGFVVAGLLLVLVRRRRRRSLLATAAARAAAKAVVD